MISFGKKRRFDYSQKLQALMAKAFTFYKTCQI
jgi:hypothetical protein